MIHPAPQPPRPPPGPAAALIGTVTTMSTVVNVLVDGFERLGPLSYYTGSTDPTVGDAVAVPFGKRTATGVVLGPGNPSKAEKDILSVHGPRSTPQDLEAATTTARTQLSPVTSMMRRLAPTSNKGSAPINAGPVTLAREWPFTYTIPDGIVFTLLLTPPLVSSAAVAAVEARRMSDLGQVLVLCLLTPFSSVTPAFCASLGCKPALASILNALSLVLSLVVVVMLLVIWQV